MIENENDKQVHMSTEMSLKNKKVHRDKNKKWVRNYNYVVSTCKLSNDREK